MIPKRLMVLCIFSIALLLLCSSSFAAEEKPNACKAKYEKQQDASLKQYMTMLPKQNVYLGRGKIAIKDIYVPNNKNYKYYTKFNKDDLLMAYDAFVIKPNGEAEVFSEYNGYCRSMGFIAGQFVSTFPAYLEDMMKKYVPDFKMPILMYTLSDIDSSHKAKYRRTNYVSFKLLSGTGKDSFSYENSNYELTFINQPKVMLFIRLRNKPQYYFTIGGTDLLIASSPQGNIFGDYGINNLPEKVDNKNIVYLKVSCKKKGNKGSEPYYPWLWQSDYDSLSSVGDCLVTRETPQTLKGDGKAIKSRANEHDLSFSAPSRGISFMLYPYSGTSGGGTWDWPNDLMYRFVTYGNEKGLSVEGVTINNDPSSSFETLVIANKFNYDGLKVFNPGSDIKLGLTSDANYDQLLFSSNYYEKVDAEGMGTKRDALFGVMSSISFYNLIQGNVNYNNLFMAQYSGRLKIYKNYNAETIKQCEENFAHYNIQTGGSYKVRNFLSSCYFIDKSLLIIHDKSTFPCRYNLLSYGKSGEEYNVEFEYLRQNNAATVLEATDLVLSTSYGPSQAVRIIDAITGSKIISFSAKSINFVRSNSNTPIKWIRGIMGSLKFTSLVFDSKQEKIRKLSCDSSTGKCFLDGIQISSPRESLKCKSNGDCGEGMVCDSNLCVGEASGDCKDYLNGGSLSIHFYTISESDAAAQSAVDGIMTKMLLIEPFASNKNKFTVKYKNLGHYDFGDTLIISDMTLLKKLQSARDASSACSGSPQYTVYLAPLAVNRKAPGFTTGDSIVISTNDDATWQIMAHEMGHALGKSGPFGDVVDEYMLGIGEPANCDLGINCNSESKVRNLWAKLLRGTSVQSASGCGACQPDAGNRYKRPDGYSLMNKIDGTTSNFNGVTKTLLSMNLVRFS